MNELLKASLEMILTDWTPEEDEYSHCFEKDLLYEDYFTEIYLDPMRIFMAVSLTEFGGVGDVLELFAFH